MCIQAYPGSSSVHSFFRSLLLFLPTNLSPRQTTAVIRRNFLDLQSCLQAIAPNFLPLSIVSTREAAYRLNVCPFDLHHPLSFNFLS